MPLPETETRLKALIVDDERDSRDSLRYFVEKYCPGVQVQDVCANIQEAQQAIEKRQPQLVFLDIEMPYGNAFDLLDRLEEIQFEIIFVTAFNQYAIQALNLSAAWYLLKPVDIDELVKAVQKVQKNWQHRHQLLHARLLRDNLRQPEPQLQRVALPLIDGFEVVPLKDILYGEADDNFTRFYFLSHTRPMMICRPLKYYEELLSEQGFCRIHRSVIINLEHVQRYQKGKGGTVHLVTGKELPVSQSRKADFLTRFHL